MAMEHVELGSKLTCQAMSDISSLSPAMGATEERDAKYSTLPAFNRTFFDHQAFAFQS
jgi:hypothetical protein